MRRTARNGPATVAGLITLILLVVAGLAACGDDDTPVEADEEPIRHPDGDAVVLQVRHVGGLRPAGDDFGTVPEPTVLGDGTMIVGGAQIAVFPPPILPSLFELTLSEAGLQRVLAEAQRVGLLGPPVELGRPAVADASTTVIDVNAGGVEVRHEIYALDPTAPSGPGVDDAQASARQEIATFLGDLRAPAGSLVSAEEVTERGAYEPERIAIRASPSTGAPETEAGPDVTDWPLPDVQLAAAADCLVIDGPQVATLLAALEGADTETLFRQDGTSYELQVRPLLPPERGCEDITEA